ncbi:MAG: hypothetical protein ACRD2Z_16520 [Thermoanaerobaculia bacterium]
MRFAALGLALWAAPALGCDPSTLSAPRAPTIDGVLTPGEWQMARVVPLAGGGELLVLPAGDSLFVAVHAESRGIAHLCVADGEEIAVLHASAALGAARYAASESGWRLREGFTWELRDTLRVDPPTVGELNAFFATHGWVANPNGSGTPLREFRIECSGEVLDLAAAHLDVASGKVSLAGATAADGCGDLNLVRGNPPPLLVFEPESWLRVECPAPHVYDEGADS